MSQEQWAAVDRYITDLLLPADPVLDAALADSAAAGLPAINVTPNQGKLLHLLARAQGARRILEVGTLGGYSTIWLARALPVDGYLVTLEVDPKHADGTVRLSGIPGSPRALDDELSERSGSSQGIHDQFRRVQWCEARSGPRASSTSGSGTP